MKRSEKKSTIKKVIIPVAGFGTRFLPATKAQPKEMLPIIDKPVIQYIVEEAVASGIDEVILVTGASKRAIEDHFDYNHELQSWLKKQGKDALREEIKQIADMANFIYVRQKGVYGNATPVLNCKDLIGNEPFALLWGDDLFSGGARPRLAQLIETFERYGDPVVAAIPIDDAGTEKFGVIRGAEVETDVYQIDTIVEKPGPRRAPSRIGAVGGYVLTPDIFDVLLRLKPGKNKELGMVDALAILAKQRPIYARMVHNDYHDTGSKIGWLKANVDFALKRPDLHDEFRRYLRSIIR